MGIFNRSHYEDVLVVRVKELVPEAVWQRRYRHIREFERMLGDNIQGRTVNLPAVVRDAANGSALYMVDAAKAAAYVSPAPVVSTGVICTAGARAAICDRGFRPESAHTRGRWNRRRTRRLRRWSPHWGG